MMLRSKISKPFALRLEYDEVDVGHFVIPTAIAITGIVVQILNNSPAGG